MKKSSVLIELEYRLALFGVWCVRMLPFSFCRVLGRLVAFLVFLVDKRHRQRAVQHLMHAGVCETEAEARRTAQASFQHGAMVFAEMFGMSRQEITTVVQERVSMCGSRASSDRFLGPVGSSQVILVCEFFGHPAMTHSSPARLHLKTGVPIMVAVLRRCPEPMTFEFVCCNPIEYTPSDDPEADVQAVTQCYTTALEGLIREAPEQWVWAHRRWKDINRHMGTA